ncbi:hypothetical protein V6N12_062314 [Hibiscus sabdariffa]|uniref:Uncharacterized protein n=1 Tax=Hibiscus sabdariffa TaxID=183260 RepID=A0ABR2F8J8_9ROSI
MAQVVRLRDGVVSLTLRFAWVVPLVLAARPVAWLLVDERLLAAATGASFSSCSRTHLPWHVSHSIVPWFPCLVVLTARASRWPTLAVGLVVWLIIVDWQLGAAPIVYLPALNNGAARWLCVWHRPCGPALSMADPRRGFGCLPCRMVAWFWVDAWCYTGCRMVSSSLARKSRARALVYLPVFRDGAAR